MAEQQKIVAIYLKTSIVINAQPAAEYLKFIHPPIDRVILKNLPKNEGLAALRKLNWTQLNEELYWDMVGKLRKQLNLFDWRLELLWHPEQTLD